MKVSEAKKPAWNRAKHSIGAAGRALRSSTSIPQVLGNLWKSRKYQKFQCYRNSARYNDHHLVANACYRLSATDGAKQEELTSHSREYLWRRIPSFVWSKPPWDLPFHWSLSPSLDLSLSLSLSLSISLSLSLSLHERHVHSQLYWHLWASSIPYI